MENQQQKTLLIVDADPFLTALYAERLGSLGFSVLVARNSQEAHSLLSLHSPQAVVVDRAALDESDSLHVVINESNLPLIVLSQEYEDHHRDEAEALGAKAFFSKCNSTSSEIASGVSRLLS